MKNCSTDNTEIYYIIIFVLIIVLIYVIYMKLGKGREDNYNKKYFVDSSSNDECSNNNCPICGMKLPDEPVNININKCLKFNFCCKACANKFKSLVNQQKL